MSTQESKPVEPVVDEVDAKLKAKQPEVESEGEEEEEDDEPAEGGEAAGAAGASSSSKKKKKKSKRKKAKELLTGKSEEDKSAQQEADLKKAIQGLTPEQVKELMALNPALAQEVAEASGTANPTADQAAKMLKNLNLQDIMTGLAAGGKNVKEMGAYKFWQTQPVPRFDDNDKEFEEGPIRVQKVEDVSKERAPLVPGFEWVEMDLQSDEEIKEVYELLNGHYVEDDEAMFRFNYSPSFLRWYVQQQTTTTANR